MPRVKPGRRVKNVRPRTSGAERVMVDRTHIRNGAAAGRMCASAWRSLRALALCLLALLALAPPLVGPARAEPVRADISVDTSGGFARIVFRFSEEIEADVKLANNILVVTFKTEVSANVDRLAIDARGYVNAARRDPDGMAVRMAIGRKVELHSMMVADRLFIDLLPDGFQADAHQIQRPGGYAVAFLDQAKQDVLGADAIAAPRLSLVQGQVKNPARLVGKPPEHGSAPSCKAPPSCR